MSQAHGRPAAADPDATVVLAPIDPSGGTPMAPEPPEESDDPGVAGHSAVMAIGSLVSRGTGFLRTLVLTAALGGLLVGNAYTTAQFFPGMIYELLIGGVLTSVLVPVLVRTRKSDVDGGQAYAQRLLTLAVLGLGVAAILATLCAPLLTLLYTDGSTPESYRNLLTVLSYLILPAIFFYGLSALIGAVLNARGHFAAPMWSPILNNLVVIGTAALYILIFGAELVEPEEMTAGRILLIGGGTLLGIMVQAAGLVPALRRVGFRWRWRFDFRALGLRELARLGGWMFCYVGVNQVAFVILLRLLTEATDRDPNAAGALIYNNAYLLMMMAHGIIAVSVIVALLPRMSAASADGRFADLTDDVSQGVRTVTAVLAPIGVALFVLAQPIATTLFRYGAFTGDNATSLSAVLLVAALALVPFAVSQLLLFAFWALPDTKTPALLNIPVVLLRLGIQIGVFFTFAAAFTAAGLMAGNAVSYVVGALISAWLLRRRIGPLGARAILLTFGKVAVAALVATAAGLLVLHLLPGGAAPGRWESILHLVAGGTVIVVSYLAVALLLRTREIADVFAMVRRRLGR